MKLIIPSVPIGVCKRYNEYEIVPRKISGFMGFFTNKINPIEKIGTSIPDNPIFIKPKLRVMIPATINDLRFIWLVL